MRTRWLAANPASPRITCVRDGRDTRRQRRMSEMDHYVCTLFSKDYDFFLSKLLHQPIELFE
jgi:hypothetical protein